MQTEIPSKESLETLFNEILNERPVNWREKAKAVSKMAEEFYGLLWIQYIHVSEDDRIRFLKSIHRRYDGPQNLENLSEYLAGALDAPTSKYVLALRGVK